MEKFMTSLVTQSNRKTITKHHKIITAKMSLTPRELDLLSLLAMKVKADAERTMIDSEGNFDPDISADITRVSPIYSISIKELSKALNVSVNTLTKPVVHPTTGKVEPSALEKACRSIRRQEIGYRDDDGKFEFLTILPNAGYNPETKMLELETTQTVIKLLLGVGLAGNNFGKTDAKLFFSLKGEYDKRILDLISRFKNNRDFNISLGEFCEIFNVDPANYANFATFRRTVIEKPLARIIKASNGMWTARDKLGKGYHLKRGAKPNDLITFKMLYTPIDTI